MKKTTRVKKSRKGVRPGKSISLSATAEEPKRRSISVADIEKWYKPIKKPVTLRLDAEVLAWFKKSGRGYQTRINRALWKLMQEGKKEAGKR